MLDELRLGRVAGVARNRGLPLAVELQPYVANIGISVFHNSVAPIFLAGLGTFITIFHTFTSTMSMPRTNW